MSHCQQPQQPSVLHSAREPTSSRKEQLLSLTANLQQQVNQLLIQQQGSHTEMAKPPVFRGKMEEVSAFINVARLYIGIKMERALEPTKVAWVLSYIQGGVAKA